MSMSRAERDVWEEIDALNTQMADLIVVKRAALKSHSEEIEAATAEIEKRADEIRRLAVEVGALLDA